MDGRVRERERVDDEELAALPIWEGSDLPLERVAVIEGLGERVADANRGFGTVLSIPLPVPALDAAALDLEADDSLARVDEHEIDLSVVRSLHRVTQHPTRGVEGLPVVVQAGFERLEHAALGLGTHVCVEQRAGIHPRHGR